MAEQNTRQDIRPNIQQNIQVNWDRLAFPWTDINPCSPKSLNIVLERLEAAPRKRWGQNFLIDLTAQQRIVRAAGIQASDRVWEIGPGLGALTQHLWRRSRSLTLFEIDPVLLDFYASRLGVGLGVDLLSGRDGTAEASRAKLCCQLVAGDVLQTWHTVWQRWGECPQVAMGNLPYNSVSSLLSAFARHLEFRPRCMVFTVQKEMAERLTAKERSKPYSSFSVLLQSQFHVECLFDLPPRLFYPRPNVTSTTVRLLPRKHGLKATQLRELERFTRAIFSQRRKTLANNIKSSAFQARFGELEPKLASLGIQYSQRAEEISIDQFLDLASLL